MQSITQLRTTCKCRSWCPRRLSRGFVAARWDSWFDSPWDCCVLLGRGLCDGPITRPQESYGVWRVWMWSWSLDNEQGLVHQGLSSHKRKVMCKQPKIGEPFHCTFKENENNQQATKSGCWLSANMGGNCSKCFFYITQWSTVLQELTVPQLFEKSLAFNGARNLINVLAAAHHSFLSSARSIHSTPPPYFLKIHFNIIHPFTRSSGLDSLVDIVTRYGLDGPEIESRWGRDFLHPSRPALGPTQAPIQWVPCVSRG